MHRAIALVLCLVVSVSAMAQPSEEKRAAYEKEHADIVKMFRTETGFEEIDRGEVLQFIDSKQSRVFLVTKPGHPAHPAVITRQAFEYKGQLFLKSGGMGRGDQNALEIWVNYLNSEAKAVIDKKREEAVKP
ncbi:hypothetical protein NWF24_06795 [Variovorax paradoxus]|uniref:hypothetical protein n=1 Tax=Variovorax paradoxus TaxID=34073 RepID=UPI0021AC6E5A|nr:hypothetical protein [Variovorax paradoxus]UVH59112.1 hypothetical protein NWF24_06795 [Variovorax paradoxus]